MSMPCAEKGVETSVTSKSAKDTAVFSDRHIETCALLRLALSQCCAVTPCCYQHIHIQYRYHTHFPAISASRFRANL